eukprot:Plantae.Rhodophyta-Palmaria_palmata.ctg6561.p1 GENE.Plantae.Rhodophyta-Palmaria_palmata.ctg6561~~Plantae.Rhodophyta-Palmaria_palmata.ctg6561.p1  ORF type:complete len:240 (-),score=28.67 Plantae.Rhodophyta-Palmaria_palmata.ctg6561:683-1402(-)
MIDHISILEMHFGQLESIGVPKDESLQLSILLDSVAVHPDYKQVVETLRVGSEDLQTWKELSKRLISVYAVNQRVKKNTKDFDNFYQRGARANVVGGAKKGKKGECHYCQRPEHFKRECFKNPNSKNYRGNNSRDDSNNENEKPKEFKKKSQRPKLAMAYVNSINTNSSDLENKDFILDSGATHHICSDLSLFHSFKEINPMEITLTDGSNVLCDTNGQVDIMRNNEGDPSWIRLCNVL